MKVEKIPIDEYGEGNCCPECGSTRIDIDYQFPLYVSKDLKTGRERFYGYESGKKVYIYKPSDRRLAARYKSSQMDAQMWNYRCRKCGWISEPFVP